MKTKLRRWSAALVAYAVGLWMIPHWWCGREAAQWWAGDTGLRQELARGVAQWVQRDLSRADFSTGSSQFNGEWLFGSYLMAGFGFAQMAEQSPAQRMEYLALVERCLDQLVSTPVSAFDRETWGNDAFATLDGVEHDHAAYLGYLNLLMGVYCRMEPASKFAELHERITGALARRMERSPLLLLQSYPREVYPVDNCAVIASIAVSGRYPELVQRWLANCRQKYVDRQTGLLIQCVNPDDGSAADDPRGSGTALGAYFLSFADRSLSRELFMGLKNNLAGRVFGFGVIREYPRSVTDGRGDIDSGPIIFGYSISATGFALAGARQNKDWELFRRLYSTAYLFGAPVQRGDQRSFVMGGPLGNAIMLAMLTAEVPR
jgi:hypothetical protein